MASEGVHLYSSWFCPFAQRAWIAILEKGLDFELHEIDPYNKTEEFLAINPRGLVPVILNNGQCVYESSICIEYIDEAWPAEHSLLPKDPYERARVRIWSDYISKKLVPKFYVALQRQTKSDQDTAKSAILKDLKEISGEMSSDGPFFSGKDFGMVDLMLIPFAIRFEILDHYRGFSIPSSGTFARFHQWLNACLSRDCVKKTMATKEKYIEIYKRYVEDTAASEVAVAIRSGGVLP